VVFQAKKGGGNAIFSAASAQEIRFIAFKALKIEVYYVVAACVFAQADLTN
jgi:hypothetical protein